MGKDLSSIEVPFNFFFKEISKFEKISQFWNETIERANFKSKVFRNYGAIILEMKNLHPSNDVLRKFHHDSEFNRLRKIYDYFSTKGYDAFGKSCFYDDKGKSLKRGILNPYHPILLYDVNVGEIRVVHSVKGIDKEILKDKLFDRISIGFWEDHHNNPL
jgi:hypothetical protein